MIAAKVYKNATCGISHIFPGKMEKVCTQKEVQESLDKVMESDSNEQEESDREDRDTAEEEYLPESESSSESLDVSSDSGKGVTEPTAGWTSRCGEIQWAPTNTHTQIYTPASTGMVQGPTHYATSQQPGQQLQFVHHR